MSHPLARFLIVLALALLLGAPFGSSPAAASECPTFPYTLPDNTPATLIAAVQCANQLSDENTVIDLNNQTITFTSGYQNGGQALPDLGSMTLRNGTLNRSAQAMSEFRFFSTSGVVLRLENITLNNGGGSSIFFGGAINHASGLLVLTKSTLTNNVASFGGALYLGGTSSIQLRIINSTLSNNQASAGGALYSEANNPNGNGPQTEIFSSTLSANQTTSSSNASALHVRGSDLSVYNSVLSGNSGGPAIKGNGNINIRNTTIAGNYAASGTGGVEIVNDPYVSSSSLTLVNSILWDNSGSADYILPQGNSSIFTGSTIESSSGQDPLFVSGITPSATPSTSGNFRLSAGSPAINGGDNGFIQTDVYDIDGDNDANEGAPDRDLKPRIVNTTVDRGAYEFVQQPGITLSETSASVTEGGATDTYTVVLNTPPTADVTVTLSGNADASVSPATVTFTPANWNTAQTVTVTAVNDNFYEADHTASITHAAASTDTNYNGLSIGAVTANITDDESIVYRLVSRRSATAESNTQTGIEALINIGGSGTGDFGFDQSFTVGLTVEGGTATQTTDYTISGSVSFAATQSLTTNTLTELIALTIVDDSVDEANETIEIALVNNETGTSGSYDAGITRITPVGDGEGVLHTFSILDDDTAGVTLSKTSVSVAEGGATDTYTVRLNSQPTANVTVTALGSGNPSFPNSPSEVSLNPSSLTFTPQNWNVAQTVTVTAVDDAVAENAHSSTISHSTVSGDTTYDDQVWGSVMANITDNDAGVTLSKITVNIAEGGATDTYTVVLRSQPTADVTFSINGGAQTTVNPTSLTFTSANWNTPQTVTVSATDDAVAEGGHGGTITHTTASADASYNGLTVVNVTAVISDNDDPGIVLSTSSVSAT
jgi:hypothetical protein